MIISFRGRASGLHELIQPMKSLPFNFGDFTGLPEKESCVQIPVARSPGDLGDLNFLFLFDYDVFPHSIMDHASEWTTIGRGMEVGDIIIQQVNFPPGLSTMKIIFGVRILE